jgi:hypothetical protein
LFSPLSLGPRQAILARALLIGLLACLIRVAFVLDFTAQPLFDVNLVPGTDMETLVGWARRIAGGDLLGRGSGPFWWAPLFPYTLGGILTLVGHDYLLGAALAQAALGAVTCALVYLLGRWLLDEATGLLGGLMAAAYGPAIFYTGVFLSTTLEVFLAVVILLAITAARARPTRTRWVASGIAAGLGCLARPNFLLSAALMWICLPGMVRPPTGGANWPVVRKAGIAFCLGLALTIAPATLRNWGVGGQVVLVSAAGPETFRIANSYDSTPLNFIYPKRPQMPVTSGAFWRHQARKAVLFWWGFETPQNVNYYLARERAPVLALPWVPFWLAIPLAAVGVWSTRHRARALAHVYVLLGGYYLSVVAFFVIARWRLPLVVPLLVLSAAGLLALFRWARTRQWYTVGIGSAVVLALAVVVRPSAGPFIFAADHGQLGYILVNRGADAEAARHLAQAAAGLPGNATLHRDLGLLLDRLGRTAEAQAALERAVALAPDDPLPHRYLGRLLLARGGDQGRARAHLERALELTSQGDSAAEVRAVLETPTSKGRRP